MAESPSTSGSTSSSASAASGPDLGAAVAAVAAVAARVGDEQLEAATPCPEYRVRNLLGHLVGLTAAFRDAARKDLGPSTGTDPGSSVPDVDGDWRVVLPKQLDELAEAWRSPAAWEGMTQAGGFTFPASEAGMVALNEVVVHGWDLARATGQDYPADPASLAACLAMLEPVADAGPEVRGPFGPAIVLPSDAPLLDRVIGLTGRDPAWAAPAQA